MNWLLPKPTEFLPTSSTTRSVRTSPRCSLVICTSKFIPMRQKRKSIQLSTASLLEIFRTLAESSQKSGKVIVLDGTTIRIQMKYQVDPVRQAIADSWPNKMDDVCARKEWGCIYLPEQLISPEGISILRRGLPGSFRAPSYKRSCAGNRSIRCGRDLPNFLSWRHP